MIDWKKEKEKIQEYLSNEDISYEEIGRIFGCSGANIKKQAKKLGIQLKPRRKINERETFNKGLSLKHEKYSYKNVCPICGGEKCTTASLCKTCADKKKRNIGDKELGYYIGYGNERKKYASKTCQDIRKDAKRVILESNVEKVCSVCHNHEFDDILEVHHIKGILDFDEHTLIKDINNINNLVWLCPNHHAMIHLKNKPLK